jgi:hypothetical protein
MSASKASKGLSSWRTKTGQERDGLLPLKPHLKRGGGGGYQLILTSDRKVLIARDFQNLSSGTVLTQFS